LIDCNSVIKPIGEQIHDLTNKLISNISTDISHSG